MTKESIIQQEITSESSSKPSKAPKKPKQNSDLNNIKKPRQTSKQSLKNEELVYNFLRCPRLSSLNFKHNYFMIKGELIVSPQMFQFEESNESMETECGTNIFRPVLRLVSILNKCILIEVDNSISEYGDFEIIINLISRIHTFSSNVLLQQLMNYKSIYSTNQARIRDIIEIWKNSNQQELLKDEFDKNFAASLEIAEEFVRELILSKKIIIYRIKRIDLISFQLKTHSIGVTDSFLNVFCGHSQESRKVLQDKLMREGLPNFYDFKGAVQCLLASFQPGIKSDIFDFITVDLHRFPCTLKQHRIPLSYLSFNSNEMNCNNEDLMPKMGLFCDELIVQEFTPVNVQDLFEINKQRRTSTLANYERSDMIDFTYEIESEKFIQRHYQTHPHLLQNFPTYSRIYNLKKNRFNHKNPLIQSDIQPTQI